METIHNLYNYFNILTNFYDKKSFRFYSFKYHNQFVWMQEWIALLVCDDHLNLMYNLWW